MPLNAQLKQQSTAARTSIPSNFPAPLLHRIEAELAQGYDRPTGLTRALENIADHSIWEAAGFWEPAVGFRSALRCTSFAFKRLSDSKHDGTPSLFRGLLRNGEGLPGRSFEARSPFIESEVDPGVSRWRRRELNSFGASCMLCVPLLHDGEILGVLELLSHAERSPSKMELQETTACIEALAIWLRGHADRESANRNKALKAAVMETSFDIILITDHDGALLETNAAGRRAFGLLETASGALTLGDIIATEEARERYQKAFMEQLRNGVRTLPGRLELPIRVRGGLLMHAELRISRILWDRGPVFAVVVRDLRM